MNTLKNKIICAIDIHDWEIAISLIDEIQHLIGAIKLGLEFFMAFGIDGIKKIIDLYPDIKIFLDLKFHDIPNTVEGALKTVVLIPNVFLTTIHATGGAEMISRARDLIDETSSKLKIVAVTRLTSLVFDAEKTFALTELALHSGADGIVCPAEICKEIRQKFSSQYGDFIIVTPGIRLLDSNIKLDDQRATSTPKQAVLNGSSYLVIGRPITHSVDKKGVILKILQDINE
jgi:orotidine-5'-phosphate decarboxylase